MKFRPFLPATSIVLAGITAVLIWNLTAEYRSSRSSDTEGFTVSGRVVAADPAAVKDVQVRIRWLEDGVVRSVTVPVRPDGTFSADRLLPGVYSVAATRGPAEGEAAARALASSDVTVVNANVSGVVLKLPEL